MCCSLRSDWSSTVEFCMPLMLICRIRNDLDFGFLFLIWFDLGLIIVLGLVICDCLDLVLLRLIDIVLILVWYLMSVGIVG